MNAETLGELFYAMLRIRLVEERIAELYAEQEMRCPVHLCIGQEAVAVGVCANLSPDDYVLSGHRSHGHYLAKGGNLKTMLAELYGKVTGCAQGKGGSMHLVDLAVGFLGAAPIVGSTIPIAVGAAFGSALRGERRVAVAFFGEGATEEGIFHESLNFAAMKKLPVVFVCENNLYSVYSPLSVRQPAERDLMAIAAGHGVAAERGDGNDVAVVYALAGEAAARARQGGGPTLLELTTYRWREHCGPLYDNDLGYRSEAEFEGWRQRCPVAHAERTLGARGALDEAEIARMHAAIAAEIDDAVAFAKTSPFPKPSALLEHVYAQ
ncbi:MAG: thiamine pyrophosphate-dependent dehydrogenase E1 component subunit alpha [Chloroflexi bacterium]|nr:thiamine pyrophosphate-dependent dehydrogenase E1 component subunit alpha [Chloroflexota bacterium]